MLCTVNYLDFFQIVSYIQVTLTIDVNDINEAPTVSIVSTATVDETAILPETTIATMMANDVDDGTVLNITCTFDPDDGKFAGSCDSAGGHGRYIFLCFIHQ